MNSRRAFFGLLGTGIAASASEHPLPSICAVSDARCGGRARIILDGKDISTDCYRAELFTDGRGIAYCFKKDSFGQHMIDASGEDVMKETRTGAMEIRPL